MGETITTVVPVSEDVLNGANDKEHIDKMMAKAEEGTNFNGKDKTEGLLAGKYKTPEQLQQGTMELLIRQHGSAEAAYKALESGLGKTTEETPASEATPDTDAGADAGADEDTNAEAARIAAEANGSDEAEGDEADGAEAESAEAKNYQKYQEEFVEKGALSPESYADIEKEFGIGKSEVDTYLRGVMSMWNDLANVVGGQGNYRTIMEWAGTNLSEGQISAYNKALDSSDMNQMKMALTAVNAEYVKANGSQPKRRISGNGDTTPAGGDGFSSYHEFQSALRDKRYNKDRSFTAEVQKKLARTRAF